MAFLLALKQVILYAGVSDANLEEGNMRCDVNVSVAPAGQTTLGVKAEIKNMNTFKGVHAALRHEVARQLAALRSGGRIVQETRRWDPDRGETESMRTKEDAHDYRYFPEPDLMPVELPAATLAAWRAQLPERPRERRQRLVGEYGLPDYDAGVLAADRSVADYYEAAARASSNPKAVSIWMMTEMLRLLAENARTIAQVPMTPAALARLIALVDDKVLNSTTAKEVFGLLFQHGGDPDVIIREKGLAQVSDSGAIAELARRVVAENAKSAADYRNGKQAALQHLVGQVMRLSRGKANPQVAAQELAKAIAGGAGG
jgi:aspartyl-tRNA(Asn)/glutamyl-tRNA(Gln) amidotransferase subunit B